MSEKTINNKCDYGNHYVGGDIVCCCVVCGWTVCRQHQGNPDVTAGSYVACPNHVEEVAQMNQEWLEKFRQNYAGG